MGYYTNYELTWKCGDKDLYLDHEKEIVEQFGPVLSNECKWYSWESHMKEYSKKYPNTLFILSGEGEESGDLWKAYIQNGKKHFVKGVITFEEFDPEKMEQFF